MRKTRATGHRPQIVRNQHMLYARDIRQGKQRAIPKEDDIKPIDFLCRYNIVLSLANSLVVALLEQNETTSTRIRTSVACGVAAPGVRSPYETAL